MRKLLIAVACLSAATSVQAEDIEIINPVQSAFRGLSEDMGAAFSYKGLSPAEPYGITGFNVGVVASYTSVENEGLIRDLTGEDIGELGMAGISAIKGLPFGIDVGAFYVEDPNTNVSLVGAEVRYAIVEGNVALPAVGLRAALTQINGIDSFDFRTYSIDVSVSKGFTFITPYAGIGQVFVESDPDAVFGLEKESFDQTRLFAGARATIALFNVTGEIEKNGDNTLFNLRLGVGF